MYLIQMKTAVSALVGNPMAETPAYVRLYGTCWTTALLLAGNHYFPVDYQLV